MYCGGRACVECLRRIGDAIGVEARSAKHQMRSDVAAATGEGAVIDHHAATAKVALHVARGQPQWEGQVGARAVGSLDLNGGVVEERESPSAQHIGGDKT